MEWPNSRDCMCLRKDTIYFKEKEEYSGLCGHVSSNPCSCCWQQNLSFELHSILCGLDGPHQSVCHFNLVCNSGLAKAPCPLVNDWWNGLETQSWLIKTVPGFILLFKEPKMSASFLWGSQLVWKFEALLSTQFTQNPTCSYAWDNVPQEFLAMLAKTVLICLY